MRTTYVIPAALVIAVLTGCAAPRHAGGPGTGTAAVILYRHSPFNLDMTDRVREYLELQRYRVIVDEAHNAGRYTAATHAAVIFLVKNEAEREMRAVENFLNRNRRTGNIIVSVSHEWGEDDAQWTGNFDNPGGGIGDVSYTFARLEQRTWDVTVRGSWLFDRDKSLELYVQPFLTYGDFSDLRELAQPDTYDLRPYDGFDVREKDFSLGAVNLNLVYRWEYRPGSTIFLVWQHARENYDRRGWHGSPDDPLNRFTNDFSTDPLFDNEARNTFLLKASYWLPI